MNSEVAPYFSAALIDSQEPELREIEASRACATEKGIPTTADEESDAELLESAGKKSKDALSILFRRYARPVRSIGARILRNQQEAEDLVQEVFITIFNSAAQFRSHSQKASSWILHIAYQRAFDRRRYLNTRRFCNEHSLEELIDTGARVREQGRAADPLSALMNRQLLEKFEVCLSGDQKLVLQLFFFEGYSLREIAPMVDQSTGNVRNHYYRGLQELRRHIPPELVRSK